MQGTILSANDNDFHYQGSISSQDEPFHIAMKSGADQ